MKLLDFVNKVSSININNPKNIKIIAIASANEVNILKAASCAMQKNIAKIILVGDQDKINLISKQNNINIKNCEVIHCKDDQNCANIAVALVRENKADVLAKGALQTSALLRAVLNKNTGIRVDNKILSHVGIIQSQNLGRLIFVSDGAMIINPTLEEKIAIINNAVFLAQKLDVKIPKVAIISALELVNPKIPSTIDAAILTQMNQRNQIVGCIIDGPLGLDNALSLEAAKTKNINSKVAGLADILIAPNIEAANMAVKSAIYLGDCVTCGIIMGAQKPIVLTSRADSCEAKLVSMAIACQI